MKRTKLAFAKRLLLVCLMILGFSIPSFSQMNSWGTFGGGKIEFPSMASSPNFVSSQIPPPNIGGTVGWPSNWRGFNAAFDDSGNLLFYVIDGYWRNANNERGGGIFDANGTLITTTNGCGKNIIILPYPENCGKYLVIEHDEEESPDGNFTECPIYFSELISTPNSITVGGFLNRETYRLPEASYSASGNRVQTSIAVSPNYFLDLSGNYVYPLCALAPRTIVSGQNSNPAHLTNYLIPITFSIGGASSYSPGELICYEADVASGGAIPVGISNSIIQSNNVPITSPDYGTTRFSEDGEIFVTATTSELLIKSGAIDYSSPGVLFTGGPGGTYDQIISNNSYSVEILRKSQSDYRIFTCENNSPGYKIVEYSYNPITSTLSSGSTIATISNRAILNKDQWGRLIWVHATTLFHYTPSGSIGAGSLISQSIASQIQTNYLTPPPLTFPEFYYVPFVIQGGQTISGFGNNSECCQQEAPFHWENASASGLGLSATLTGQTITIDGTFTVDQNLTISNCQVFMRANAKINVVDGAHFKIWNTNIEACKDMWEGIYVEDPTAKLTVYNGTTSLYNNRYIKHAIEGIVVKNGAKYTLTNANLLDNYHHLQVSDYNGTYTNSITASEFGGQPSGIGRFPHINDRALKAINVSNVSSISLGQNFQVTNGSPDQNRIYNAQNGIWIENSNALIDNWKMEDLTYTGIVGLRTSGTVKTITTNFKNYLYRMQNGIYVTGQLGKFNLTLNSNYLEDISNVGMYVHRCNSNNTIQIEGNQFLNVARAGIWVNQSLSSTVNIISNEISITNASILYPTGIYLSEAFAPNLDANGLIDINSNEINNTFSGIYLLNTPEPTVTQNFITLNTASHPNGRGVGIFAKNANRLEFNDNNVESASGSFVSNKLGIGGDFIPEGKIIYNRVNNVGDGIWAGGYSAQLQIKCNSMERYRRGLVYNYAVVGQQGTTTTGQGNEWHPFSGTTSDTYSYYTYGGTWGFYTHSNLTPWMPNLNGSFPGGPFSAISPTLISGSSSCTSNITYNLDPIVYNQTAYQNMTAVANWEAETWAYKTIRSTSTAGLLTPPYVSYRDSIDTLTTGLLGDIEIAFEANDSIGGDTLLSQILPSGALEPNAHYMLSLYSQYFTGTADGGFIADTLVDSISYQIAGLTTSGIALARWLKMTEQNDPIFNWVEDIDIEENPDGKRAENPGLENEMGKVLIYPNPSNGTISIQNPYDSCLDITLSNLFGQVIGTYNVCGGIYPIDLTNIPKGTYLISILLPNGKKEYQKVVIQ